MPAHGGLPLGAESTSSPVDDALVRSAADLAESHPLRSDHAVHLAAAARLEGDGVVVVVAGDRSLLAGARAMGLAVAAIG